MDTSVYSHALDLWKKADLTGLQKQLDDDILEVKERESTSLDARKGLATETKKFKKLGDNEKLEQVNKIIKQYQQGIDELTKRSQFAENVLLNIYAKLAEAPDPKSLLQNSIDNFSNVEDAKTLREQVDSLKDQLAKCADYQTLKKRLTDLEQSSATVLTKRLAAQEKELTSVWEEKQRNWTDKEQSLIKQVESLKANNQALDRKISKQVDLDGSNDKNESDSESGNNPSVNVTENNFLLQELESAQSRIFQLEKRNEDLISDLAKTSSDEAKDSVIVEKDLKINQLEGENALLSASFERERQQNENKKSSLSQEVKSLETEVTSYKSELDNVRRKLNNYSDYNRLKDELTALKKIEFGVNDVDSDNEATADSGKTEVDGILVVANKKLQSSLAELRSKDVDQKEEINNLRTQVSRLSSKIEELETMNSKLESDLENVEDMDQKFNDTASMISGATRQLSNRVGGTGGGHLSPTSSIVGIPEEGEFTPSMRESTILPIVTKQRDRFRTRNMELEKQVRLFTTEKSKLNSELMKLQSENQKLSDRIRHTSTFSGSTSSSDLQRSNYDAESQLSKSFEDTLNPLIAYKKRDSEYYKSHNLPVTERFFMLFSKYVASSRTSRTIFIAYSIGLHGLLMLLIVYFCNLGDYLPASSNSGSSHSQNLAAGAANGVANGMQNRVQV